MAAFDPKLHSMFEGRHNVQSNACVGENGCSDFETYALGYFDAAKLILKQVLDPHKCLIQDQLVYPILFNFRHGIELSLKHISKSLTRSGITVSEFDNNTHDLQKLWSRFTKQAKQDRRLLTIADQLTPAIEQIHEADPLAQEFRYSEKRDGFPSLEGRKIVDLATVYQLLEYTVSHFNGLFGLSYQIEKERLYGSFTKELNREELEQLSKELPDKSNWSESEEFAKIRTKWMDRLGLSSRTFSKAIEFIEGHREFAGNIGMYSEIAGVNDEDLDRILKAAKKLNSYQKARTELSIESLLSEYERECFEETGVKLTPALVTKINALFYLARDQHLSEEYPQLLKHFEYSESSIEMSQLWADFAHVFEKTTFVACALKALRMVGRPDLADSFGEES